MSTCIPKCQFYSENISCYLNAAIFCNDLVNRSKRFNSFRCHIKQLDMVSLYYYYENLSKNFMPFIKNTVISVCTLNWIILLFIENYICDDFPDGDCWICDKDDAQK